jgi:putative ABC transport system permease protein
MFSAARMVVATKGDPQLAAPAIVEALRSLDPARQVRATLVRDSFARELELPQALTIGSLVLGGSALALAVIGLFGVTAFVVGQRRHEISVRMALGAGGGDVVRMLVRQSLRPVAIGTACGLVAALGVGQVIRGVLVGVSGHDPIAIAAAVGALVVAAGAAAFIPARRAARVSPADMLKQQ